MSITGLRSGCAAVGVVAGLLAGTLLAVPGATAAASPAERVAAPSAQDAATLATSTLSTALADRLGLGSDHPVRLADLLRRGGNLLGAEALNQPFSLFLHC